MIRIQQQQKQYTGDTNGDGVVDDQDTAATTDDQGAVPGDTNGDGVVDDQDTAAAETCSTRRYKW